MAVIDITCPRCGSVDSVQKEALGRYRCRACGREFSHRDVLDE